MLKVSNSDECSKEVQLVDVLSPVSRKRTGRAYVALARSHSEKQVASYMCVFNEKVLMLQTIRGNLDLALDLYRKAETYVPENIKLKER